ncbi:uncharacterized protein LOC135840514 [Planococcus citri]|uniref:uncharacterized protein LOC135840514 n=1 Tax=Planococcus citri TaxID=170843 RepID=UPI0031F823E9
MALSKVNSIHAILLREESTLQKYKRCPKPLRRVFDHAINYVKSFPNDFDELLENDDYSDPDDITFMISRLQLTDAPNRANEISDYEIQEVVESMSISSTKAAEIVDEIKTDLDNVLKKYGFTENRWRAYGSYDTGLCSVDSDVDFYYENIKRGPGIASNKIPKTVFLCLEKETNKFSDVEFIANARIPIIKLKHKSTKKDCDISFCESGVKSSRLTKFYVKLNPNLRFLTLYLKLVLKKCNMYGTNRMTSHVTFWLVVFYLQQKNLLPSVKSVRKKYSDCKDKDLFEDWNCSVNKKIRYPYNPASNGLSALLFGFAKFYMDFDFLKNVISPYLGSFIPIDKIGKWKIPDEVFPSDLLCNNNDGENSFYRHVINIQEPSILCSNLSKNVECKIVNYFVILCNELLSSQKFLPSKDLMNLSSLPCKFPSEKGQPRDMKKYTFIPLQFDHLEEKNPQKLKKIIRRKIHRALGTALDFKLKTFKEEDVFQIKRAERKHYEQVTMPVIYLNYVSTKETWSNADVRDILLYRSQSGKSSNTGLNKSVEVYLVCEINPSKGKARLLIQTDMYLSRFLHKHREEMFEF